MAEEPPAPKTAKAADPAPQPDNFPMSLDEYCTRLSARDKRVELIGGFHSSSRRAGTLTGTEAQFDALFQSFVSRPA